ncbi:hypothetical protein SELMODRAFT_415419 [Selaginella moellendorffii]|uniref:Uncharacterized protein n=1 Tax=Selaginella moellendorffii TaxID=88036 RepID=D8RW27_SELML|nr:hypothetical protein SELMODRAFT_415419 [Selaginella moellendorffii]
MGRHGQKPQGTSFMQNTFANESRPGSMHRSPRAVTISSTSGCDQGLLLIASKEEMIIDPQRASSMVSRQCELIKMREKLVMAEAWARARLQMQYEDDFFYNYDEWDSFVDLSTLRSSSGECCSISYLLEKWSWLKEQFARIRTSRLLESSTGSQGDSWGFKTCTRLGGEKLLAAQWSKRLGLMSSLCAKTAGWFGAWCQIQSNIHRHRTPPTLLLDLTLQHATNGEEGGDISRLHPPQADAKPPPNHSPTYLKFTVFFLRQHLETGALVIRNVHESNKT